MSTPFSRDAALHFFVFDLLKIGFLLVAVTHVMGLVNAFLPVERGRDWIASGRLRGMEHPAAALFRERGGRDRPDRLRIQLGPPVK